MASLLQQRRRLIDRACGILSLALDTGYASHEAFSRAFKRLFGVSPSGYRQGSGRISVDGALDEIVAREA